MGDRRIARLGVLLVVAICLTSCAVFTGKGTKAGQILVGRNADQVHGRPVTVILPSGHLAVRLGRPVDKVADDDTRDLEGRDGPDGGGFVPVSWTYDYAAMPDPSLTAARAITPTEVALEVGSDTYPLGSPYTVGANGGSVTTSADTTFFVAVDDTSAPVSVVVSYDGVDQTVDPATGKVEAGAAAPYYERGAAASPSVSRCAATGWRASGGFRVRMPCLLAAPVLTPYDAQRGWADTGHEFARIGVDTTPYDVTWRGHRVTVQKATDASTLHGQEPIDRTAADPVSSADGALADVLLFDTVASPGQPLLLRRRITVESTAPGMPTSFVATQRLDLRR